MNTSGVSDHTLSMKLHELNHTISVIPVLTQAHPLCNSDTCWYILILKLGVVGQIPHTHLHAHTFAQCISTHVYYIHANKAGTHVQTWCGLLLEYRCSCQLLMT